MRIAVATIGSRGDVQPYINLCQGLRDAGHDVALATNPTLCALAESHGVKAVPIGPPVDMGEVAARLQASSPNMRIGMVRVMKVAARLLEESYPDALAACRDADLIVTSDTGSGAAEGDRLGRPWISATLQPARVPVEDPDVPPAVRLLWGIVGAFMILPINRMRKRLGAPPASDVTALLSRDLILLPVNPRVAPPDPRWPSRVSQTGYWFARPVPGWVPPPDLEDFLGRGEKPIAVSLGVMSLSGPRARESASIVLEALRGAGVRAVVHHGGFGTTAAVFRSGVPGVVVPHVIDQFYWAKRASDLGVAPDPIPRRKLDASALASAIERALGDSALRARASSLGDAIRSEPDGVAAAVAALESYVADRNKRR